jgi:hypothetical protein
MLLNRIVTRRHGDDRSPSRGRPNARRAERRTRGLVVAAGIIALLLAMMPATAGLAADTGVYLCSARGNSGTTRANVDGTGANTSFLVPAGFTLDVAVNDQYLYWIDYTNYKIGRANLDGTSPNAAFISTGSYPSGIAVNAQYIYWIQYPGSDANYTITRANLDGTGLTTLVSATNLFGGGIALDSQYIYWAAFNNATGTTIGGRTSTSRESTGASSRA